jgi:hypothetical protein
MWAGRSRENLDRHLGIGNYSDQAGLADDARDFQNPFRVIGADRADLGPWPDRL